MTLQTTRDTFYIKQGNTSPAIEVQLSDENDNPINLSSSKGVKFIMYDSRSGNKLIERGAAIINATDGIVAYSWADGETDKAGRYRSEFVIDYPGTTQTIPNFGYKDVLVWGHDDYDQPVGDDVVDTFPVDGGEN